MFTQENLEELFKKEKVTILNWDGPCYECKNETIVTAKLTENGIKISGGAVYSDDMETFHIKCSDCFKKDKVLNNYQPCEIYSRVVGYLRPIQQYNPGKLQEFYDRVDFNTPAL